MPTNTGLLVPIDLTGYCLGTIDSQQAEKFAGATTWYSQMSANYSATIGSNVVRGFEDAPLWPLEAGIHLHWAMPDALTHGVQNADSLDFSALPNRWLLTRVILKNKKPVTKSWIIMSDLLSSDKPDNKEAPSLPVQDANQNFRYLGVSELYTGNWTEPTIPSANSIKKLFGSAINTVASGDVAFAAFYPNARNVFGFYDALDDVDTSSGAVEVMYTLVGWFSDSNHDPLNTQPTLDQLQQTYHWSCSNYPEPAPDYSLYHGQVESLRWNPDTRYITDNTTPVPATIAIGNNPSETLAAYFNGTNNEQLPHFDTLFTGFEIGALSELMQPKPGQWSALQETLHSNQFNSHNGGSIYTVQEPESGSNSHNANADSGNVYPPLSPALADAVNLLNQYQQEFDLAGVELQQYYWQLFTNWYRIVQISPADSPSAYNALSDLIAQNTQVQDYYSNAQAQRDNQKANVEGMLTGNLELVVQPALAYQTPNEPTVLLAGDMFNAVRRYGGDGQHNSDGYLICRLNSDTVTQLTVNIHSSQTLTASSFNAVDLPTPNHLTYAQEINQLLEESCLLNTDFTATLFAGTAATLETDLIAWLQDNQQTGNSYLSFTGKLPSPVAVQWLDGNPWLPMYLRWTVNFYPLLNVSELNQQGKLNNYPDHFFISNFSVDPDNIGTIQYQPGTGGIDIDPATIDFSDTGPGIQQLKGSAILSPSASDTLESNINEYLATHTDASLTTIYQELKGTDILMQAMSGFNATLLMAQEALQLSISTSVAAGTPVANLTKQVQRIISDLSQLPPLTPMLNGFFNPLRAGFMKFTGSIIDVFGQMRPLQIDNLYIADTMKTVYNDKPVDDVLYLQPRLAQASRLLFRWLAADSTEYDEMNFHPATTPVCGWLLTNHLNGGFFIYDQQGRPLGSLIPSLDNRRIVWQSTPGDDETIDQTVDQVMDGQNPYLAEVVKTLAGATPKWFGDFWQTVDKAAGLTTPSTPSSDIGLGTLVGRPLALVQASLLLEMQGYPSYNLGWNTIDRNNSNFTQTDNGLSTVQFPLVLGDIDQIDDGLIGYFKQDTQHTYDYSTFYSESAPSSHQGVMQPTATTLLATPHADSPKSAPSVNKGEQKVLMLMDPRAGIHLSSGILPTQFLQIPPDQYIDVLRSLEMAFLITPVLQPASQIALPLGVEKNYTWSWVDENIVSGNHEWQVTADIKPPSANAVWSYTPQQVSEGWLRLNPLVLRFALTTISGKRSVMAGTTVDLVLTLTNLLNETITFTPADIINEGQAPNGSVFFIHFGTLVKAVDIAKINIAANGWIFKALNDSHYGNYWAATPSPNTPASVAAKQSLTISVNGVAVNDTANGQCKVYFDYYKVTGIAGNGDAVAALGIQTTPH